ncbi:MAG: IS4 family transposase [bacterium]|nr:IS4 family transposase [bacterium]
MNQGKYVFSQIMEFVPYYQFNECVKRYKGHYRVRDFTCREQFLSMAFGQLTYRESLRDVVICLRAQESKLYHLGFSSLISKTTLARANEKRDWRIYRDFAQILIQEARRLYCDDKDFNLNLDGACYAIDSSTIELCLNIFKWARLIKVRAAVRLHLMLDLNGNIPAFFDITSAKVHDVNFLDMIELETEAYYIMDRGYIDFERFYAIHQAGAFFVTRAKNNFAFRRLYSNKADKKSGVRCDQIIKLNNYQAARKYPDKLRRIKYFDKETKKHFVFLTNDFNIEAEKIANLYKHRWQIELFFKWIKQHLKIKSFWGYSANAVKTQICIAICTYLIVAIIKKKLNINRNLYEILQILSVSPFDKIRLDKLISETKLQTFKECPQKQASLWDF